MTHLVINSQARIYGDSHNFEFRLANAIQFNDAQLISAVIPYSIYNIRAGNNTLTWNTGSVTITPGSYTASSLVTAINAAFVAGGYTLSISYSSSTYKFTITNGVSISFDFSTQGIRYALGFGAATRSGSSITSDNAIQLNNIRHLFITISEVNAEILANNEFKFTFAIPVSVNPGEVIIYENKNHANLSKSNSNRTLSRFNVSIRNANNELVDLNGSDIELLIKLTL